MTKLDLDKAKRRLKKQKQSSRNLIVLLTITLAFSLVGCNGAGNTTFNGGGGVHAGPLSLSVTANSRGDVVLSGQAAIPLIGNTEIGFDGIVGFETTLREAQDTAYQLFILWENENGAIHRDTYSVGQPFHVEFSRDDWVRTIHADEKGNIIVFVERDKIIRYRKASVETSSCRPVRQARLSVGNNATVAVFQVKVHTEPGLSAPLVDKKYFKQGRVLNVIDGPVCQDDWLWWSVYNNQLGYGGWVSEGDQENYYLRP